MTGLVIAGGILAYLGVGVVTLGVGQRVDRDRYPDGDAACCIFAWPLLWLLAVFVGVANLAVKSWCTARRLADGVTRLLTPAKSLPRATVIKDSK